jgi:hypothetical protein
MVAQWFPKLARLEPDGRWAHFPFHRLSEFYADFGRYDVRIQAPASFRVGASGRLVDTQEGDPTVHHYRAEPVHDFAFVAWDGFEEIAATEGGVAIRALYPAGREEVARIEVDNAVLGLRHFGAMYGPYPYDTLTIVHPPDDAGEAGGMEYPTLITTGRAGSLPRMGARVVEAVTLHELAHQWFYGVFASDEHTSPFLDEGLTTYAEIDVLEALYGSGSALDLGGLRLSATAVARVASTLAPLDVIAQPAHAFASGSDYGALVYTRTALLLHTLRRVWGDERMARVFRSYAKRARFAHPTARDLFAAVAGELGDGAAEMLRRGLYERGWVDYQVAELRSDRGESSVLVRRLGGLELPVEIDLHFEDGGRERVTWDGAGSHHRIERSGESRLVHVVVDPESRILVDADLSNNVMTSQRRRLAPRVLAAGAAAAALTLPLVSP